MSFLQVGTDVFLSRRTELGKCNAVKRDELSCRRISIL